MTVNLREASLPPVLNTSANNLIADFFQPALMAAVRYDRGVGYFSASWLRLAATGMSVFAANGGHARWVTSPILNEDDWKALQFGEAARTDAVLRRIIERDVTQLERTL